MRLLIADDEKEFSNAVCAILKHHKYSVDAVYNGQDALDYGLAENYAAIILDIMMPKMNGIDVLKALRAHNVSTPIILLTAKSEVEDRVAGLDAGADDYLPKPFAMTELLARIRALTRRHSNYVQQTLTFENISLDRTSFELIGPDGSERLRNKEFQMLEMLMEHPRQLISSEQFMVNIWGYDTDVEINTVWVYISYLRKKLTAVGASAEIKAIRGVGYCIAKSEPK